MELQDKSKQLLAKLTHLTLRKKIVISAITASAILATGGTIWLNSQPELILKSGAEITNLDALLKEAESMHALTTVGLKTLSADGEGTTLCFAQLDEATKSVTDTLACGLSLHASATEGSYDGLSVTWNEDVDGNYTGSIAGVFQPYAGMVEEGTSLRRPDGKEALPTSALTADSPVQVLTQELIPDGGYGLLENLEPVTPITAAPQTISTPNATTDVAVGSTEVVTAKDGTEYALPADGSQFVTFTIQQNGAGNDYAAAVEAYDTAQQDWSDQKNSLSYSDSVEGGDNYRAWKAESARLQDLVDAADVRVTTAQKNMTHYQVNIKDSTTKAMKTAITLDVDGVLEQESYTVLVPFNAYAELQVTTGETIQTLDLIPGKKDLQVASNNENTTLTASARVAEFPNGSEVRSSTPDEGMLAAYVNAASLSTVSDGQFAPEGSAFLTLAVTGEGRCDATSQDALITGYGQTDMADSDGVAYGAPTEVVDGESASATDLVWEVDSAATEFVVSLRPSGNCSGKFLMSDQTFDYDYTAEAGQVGEMQIVFSAQAEEDAVEAAK